MTTGTAVFDPALSQAAFAMLGTAQAAARGAGALIENCRAALAADSLAAD